MHKAARAVHSARRRKRRNGAGRGRRGAASDAKACAGHLPDCALGGAQAGVGSKACAAVRAVAAWFGPCVAAHIKEPPVKEFYTTSHNRTKPFFCVLLSVDAVPLSQEFGPERALSHVDHNRRMLMPMARVR